MAEYKVDLACLRKSTSSVDMLKINYACLYFELQQFLKGTFNCHDFQWVDS